MHIRHRRRFPVLALAAVLVAPVQAQTPSRVETTRGPVQITYETYRLPNGLNVILSRDASVPVVAVNLRYNVGSAHEEPGRTGFAHLFEHVMFQGSAHVREDQHFQVIQEAGGTLNGSTSTDWTNYFEVVPANFLETALWLESDRMGFLLPALTQEKLDNQRSVVQNERRQRYENAPYGLAWEAIFRTLYPAGHPYHHMPIGSMEDLNAATLDDVRAFFRRYYAPSNASLAIVGDFDPAEAKRLVAKYFGPIPPAAPVERPSPRPTPLDSARHVVLEDRVQLPRLYLAWRSPGLYAEGDADLDVLGSILSDGKNSRLHRRLVYDEQLAQFVSAGQQSLALEGQFQVTVQAMPGVGLNRIRQVVDEELERLRREPPTAYEVERARNNIEAGYIRGLQSVAAKADRLNAYFTHTGDPGYLDEDLERYRRVTPESVQRVAREVLGGGRVVLSVVPQGKPELQATR